MSRDAHQSRYPFAFKVLAVLEITMFFFSTIILDYSYASGQAPTALNLSFSTPMNTSKLITLQGTDPEGDPLTYSIVTAPLASQGTLTLVSGPDYTFTPTTSFVGSATFTFRVNDGTSNSNTATVTVTVTAPVVGSGSCPA